MTPQKCGDVYWYDLLPNHTSSSFSSINTPTVTSSSLSSASSSQRSSSCSHSTTASSLSSSSSSYSSAAAAAVASAASNQHNPHLHFHSSYPQQQQQHHPSFLVNLLPAIMAEQQDTYDTPKPAVHISFDRSTSSTLNRTSPPYNNNGNHGGIHAAVASPSTLRPMADDSYDIPRPSPGLLSQHNITPSSSNSSLLTTNSDSLSLSSSNRSSMAMNMPDYDIPRRHPLASNKAITPTALPTTPTAQPLSGTNSTYDIPQLGTAAGGQHHQTLAVALPTKKELPLELSSALETLNKLQNEATSAVTR